MSVPRTSFLLLIPPALAAFLVGCAASDRDAPPNAAAPSPSASPGMADEPGAGHRDGDSARNATPRRASSGHHGDAVTFFGERPEVAVLPFENRLLANLRQHSFSTDGLDFDPAIFPDGRSLVFASTRNSERPDIYMKHVDGTAITQLTADPADDIQPRVSGDGNRLAYCSNRTGNWDVWMLDLATNRLTQLTGDPSDEIAPCWSPDGETLAFTLWGPRSQRWEIWTLSVANPGQRRFLVYGMFPDWSPDGRMLTFQRARERGSRWFSVWVADIVDGEARHAREIAHSDAFACVTPRWSPDGQTVVFCGVEPGSAGPAGVAGGGDRADGTSAAASAIWLVGADGGYRDKLTDGTSAAVNPTWGPDGRVYFVSTQTGVENIWSIRAAAGMKPAPMASPAPPTQAEPSGSKHD